MLLHYQQNLAQGASTGRRLDIRRGVAMTFVFALMTLSGAGAHSAAAEATDPPPAREGNCTPQAIPLPGLTSTSLSTVASMSDSGLVVGTSRETESPATVVVWTSMDHIVRTGIGGVVTDNGSTISAWAIDVNEAGVVAIDRTTSDGDGRVIAEDAVVWSESSGPVVLPAPASRPRASVIAINDKGDVVGLVRGRGRGSVPVIWRDEKRSRLPVPTRGKAIPAGINNKGLVVGTVYGRYRDLGLWTWHGGAGLRVLASPESGGALVTDVDDAGRIVGGQGVGPGDGVRTILWSDRDAPPRRLMRIDPRDLHNSGYLAAVEPGFRGIGATAYVGHRRDGGIKARLATPPGGGSFGWNNVYAVAVARGHSAFAPQGGVTIAGYAQDGEFTIGRAILWTCAHTLL